MIIRHHNVKSNNKYGKYFLATEADDDENTPDEEVTNDNKPRRNMKVITVKQDKRKRTDFSSVGDDDNADDNPVVDTVNDDNNQDGDAPTPDEAPDNAEDIGDAPADDTGNTDTTTDVDANNDGVSIMDNGENVTVPDNNGDQPQDPDAPIGANNDTDTTDYAATDDDAGTADTTDVGDNADGTDTTADAGADAGNEDFTDTGDDGTGDDSTTADAGTDGNADDQGDGEENKPGVDFDSTRKYNLFKEFMALYNACENYISKLENILKDDTTVNQIIMVCTNNLREIKSILYDYMTIKYPVNSYVQSLLFYQKMIASVQLVFAMLKQTSDIKEKEYKKKK